LRKNLNKISRDIKKSNKINKNSQLKAELAARQLLSTLGLDLTDPNYKETPRRMAEVLIDFTSSLRDEGGAEIEECFSTLFKKHSDRKKRYKGMLIQSPIRIYSLCSHHILPVIYDVAFAYIPSNGNLIGFSKVVRILRNIAKRPMNQEDFTQEAIELFDKNLRPKGVAVVVSGVHMCMKMRGVCCETVNKTSAVKGDFKEYEKTRDEFLSLATHFNHPL
jgi:GTP cyclohydrolase I